ncbi:MAG: adenylate/guanylate cyclase domain-containing protein [Granulosicoccus sp.]
MKKYNWYGQVPITTTLVAAIGILVLLTAGIVFGVGVWLAQKNTFDLLRENANQVITADVNQIEHYLKPAEYQTQFIAEMISNGEIDPFDWSKFSTLLFGALAAAPQIRSVIFISQDLVPFGVSRITHAGNAKLSIIKTSEVMSNQENIELLFTGPVWLPPVWHDMHQKTYISRAHPVEHNGKIIGAVIAEVAVQELSKFISMDGFEAAGNPFILYGLDYVLAHRLMVEGYSELSTKSPLPRLDQFKDPIVSAIWRSETRSETENHMLEGQDTHLVEVSGQEYVYIFKTLTNFGTEPMIVGAYFLGSDLPAEIERLTASLIAGLIVLLLSLITAMYLGQRIASPIVKFSAAASRIRDLDISKVEKLPESMFRELSDQAVAFNAMLRALHWFERYVPKNIVEQLIKFGDIDNSLSDARQITVMFTDVVGFSTVSEGMLAEEVAAFVNHHFSLVVQCIESEGGTVDKFMGDAVMAFWQNTEGEEHSAVRACRAALAISAAIRLDNQQRQLQYDPPVGIRIGIHTGMATVGNIGPPGRLNYTIIGDTVNIGQRLEQLGKQLYPSDNDVSILISGDTSKVLSSDFTPIAAGSHRLHGRMEAIDVFKLE